MKYLIILSLFFVACESGVDSESTTANVSYCGRVYSAGDTVTWAHVRLINGTGHIQFWCFPEADNHEDTLFRWRDSILSYRIKGDSVSGVVGDQGGNVPTNFLFVTRLIPITLGYILGPNAYYNPNKNNLRHIVIIDCAKMPQ